MDEVQVLIHFVLNSNFDEMTEEIWKELQEHATAANDLHVRMIQQ